MRTHMCGALRAEHIGETIRLGGWVHRRRDLGGIVFFDLRDRAGIVQLSFDPQWTEADVIEAAAHVGAETVVLVDGTVAARPDQARNPDMATGDVEVHAASFEIVGPADTPAIPVWRTKGEDPPAEELRLEHRFLDLRNERMQQNLALRHRLTQRARKTLSNQGFYEIETPILTRPTPEGARDYLVPSRVHQGQFYALPQSPQIYKQVLMSSGFDRYFQIARCFRDEDQRADRQPEFTQIDLEASFVGMEDVHRTVEAVLADLWDEAGHEVETPFQTMTYDEAMERYGCDKPDLRYGLEIQDLATFVQGRGFQAFDSALEGGNRVRGIRVPGGAALSRKETDRLTELCKSAGVGGLALLKRKGDDLTGPLSKLDDMNVENAQLDDGDMLVATAGGTEETSAALDLIRRALIERLEPPKLREHGFTWIVDFPLFERDDTADGWTFAHHPFTAPHPDYVQRFLDGEIAGVRSLHYDAVYNGNELGSGSLRIADPEVQYRALEVVGFPRAEADRRFGFLMRALRGGAPPHGGMALGFDRIVMLLAGADNLRDVVAFPKTTAARALFEDAPTEVSDQDLGGLGIARR